MYVQFDCGCCWLCTSFNPNHVVSWVSYKSCRDFLKFTMLEKYSLLYMLYRFLIPFGCTCTCICLYTYSILQQGAKLLLLLISLSRFVHLWLRLLFSKPFKTRTKGMETRSEKKDSTKYIFNSSFFSVAQIINCSSANEIASQQLPVLHHNHADMLK